MHHGVQNPRLIILHETHHQGRVPVLGDEACLPGMIWMHVSADNLVNGFAAKLVLK
jgi:hypothetical protein